MLKNILVPNQTTPSPWPSNLFLSSPNHFLTQLMFFLSLPNRFVLSPNLLMVSKDDRKRFFDNRKSFSGDKIKFASDWERYCFWLQRTLFELEKTLCVVREGNLMCSCGNKWMNVTVTVLIHKLKYKSIFFPLLLTKWKVLSPKKFGCRLPLTRAHLSIENGFQLGYPFIHADLHLYLYNLLPKKHFIGAYFNTCLCKGSILRTKESSLNMS